MRKSLRTRLTVYFIALAAIPLLIVGLIGAWQTYNTQIVYTLEAQDQVAKRVSEQVGNFIELRESELNALIGIRGLASLSREEQTSLLSGLFTQHGEYEELVLANDRGRELIYLSRLRLVPDEDLSSRAGSDEFERPKELGSTYFGNVVFDESTGEPSVLISTPIFSLRTGNLSYVLIAKIRFKTVWDIMARADVIGSGIVYMTDADHQVVAHANPSVVLQQTKVNLPDENALTTGLGGNSAVIAIEKLTLGEQTFFVVAEQPASEAISLAVNNIILILVSILVAIVAAGFLGFGAARQITDPIGALADSAQRISAGDLTQTAPVTSEDEIGRLAKAFNAMTRQLRELIASLESRVAERTRNLELAAEVGRSVSQVRALNEMLTDAVELIRSQFDLYYVQVYLADASQTNLVLQSGTGEVGKQLLERRHRLPLTTASINGRAALEKNPVVISDTASSLVFKPNPLLPETRSEMAVPLMIGEQVVGVLDMQSAQAGSLSQEALPAFQTLAGQLAIAIQNANSLAEAEQARAEVEKQARRLVRAGWQDYQDAIHRPEQTGFIFEQDQVLPLEAEAEHQLDPAALTASIALTGEQLGTLAVELDPEHQTTQAVELVNVVARQVAQQLESLRLLETAERYRAEAEQSARRLTRESWGEYTRARADQSLGYIYDLKEVKPQKEDALETEAALTVPIKVRDEAIGKLAIFDLDSADPETLELINTVSTRLAEHIEGLRLFNQTQLALAQTERLSAAGLRLSQAADLQEVVKVTVEALAIPGIQRALLSALSFKATGEVDTITLLANWWSGIGHEPIPVGITRSTETMPAISLFASPEPIFISDMLDDPRIDSGTHEFALQNHIRGLASLPLFQGTRQIGNFLLESDEPRTFQEDEIKLFMGLGPQIVTVLENRRQFERAQKQADREAMLNVISQKIQSATSVEAVLQIAARELGHALGAPRTIAQLSMKDKN